MKVIVFEEEAYYKMLSEMKQTVREALRDERKEVLKGSEGKNADDNEWVSTDEAMKILRIKSKTTLQKLRDYNKIKFSKPGRKISYYKPSLIEYLEKHIVE